MGEMRRQKLKKIETYLYELQDKYDWMCMENDRSDKIVTKKDALTALWNLVQEDKIKKMIPGWRAEAEKHIAHVKHKPSNMSNEQLVELYVKNEKKNFERNLYHHWQVRIK